MSKHTPGPWRMDGGGDRHTSISALDNACVADVWWINVIKPEAIANAHLIASAPDLLSVLTMVRDTLPHIDGNTSSVHSMLRDINAAIARATGETA